MPRVKRTGTAPAISSELKKLVTDGGEKALKRLMELMDSKDSAVALAAAKALAERAYGKPRQEEGGQSGPVVTIVLPGWTDKPELCGRPTTDEERQPASNEREAAQEAAVRRKVFGRVSGGQNQKVQQVVPEDGEDE